MSGSALTTRYVREILGRAVTNDRLLKKLGVRGNDAAKQAVILDSSTISALVKASKAITNEGFAGTNASILMFRAGQLLAGGRYTGAYS